VDHERRRRSGHAACDVALVRLWCRSVQRHSSGRPRNGLGDISAARCGSWLGGMTRSHTGETLPRRGCPPLIAA
jgi:hypothetical protein